MITTRRTPTCLSATLALTLLLTLAAGGTAHAGTYDVHLCGADPAKEGGPWRSTAALFDRCSDGGQGAVGMLADQLAPGQDITMTVTTAGAIKIVAAEVGAALYGAVNLGGNLNQRLYVQLFAGSQVVHGRALPHNGGWNHFADPINVKFTASQSLALRIACGGVAQPCGLYKTGSPFVGISRAVLTLAESVDPTIAEPNGTATAGRIAGKPLLTFKASDADSGVRKAVVRLGNTIVGGDVHACSYNRFRPCDPSRSERLTVDTTKVPDGPHALSIAVTDAAGNTQSETVKTVTVDNVPAPPPPPAPPAPNTAKLTAHWTANKRARRTVNRMSASTLSGHLRGANGDGIANTPITIATVPDGDKRPTVAQVRTSRTGRWEYKLPGRTRYQRVGVGWRPNAATQFVSRSLRLNVRARVRMRVSRHKIRRNHRVRFRGRLRAYDMPRRGALVELQVRSRRNWQTFRTVRTSRTGRFVARRRLDGPSRYRFRARFRKQAAVSASGSRSRSQVVRVR